jgi:hypothetical protein
MAVKDQDLLIIQKYIAIFFALLNSKEALVLTPFNIDVLYANSMQTKKSYNQ